MYKRQVLSAAIFVLLFNGKSLDISKKKKVKYLTILCITMITTTSTTGYISLVALILSLIHIFPKLQSQYDVAVSFISSETMFYIQDKVEAKKKIVFVHNDYKGMEYPEIYEKKYFAEMDVIATISDTCADIICQVFPECCNKIRCV